MPCRSGTSRCTCSRALKSLHRLPPEYEEWISAAAMLYEVGDYVNRNGRHRHAYYIIAHSEILGYTPEQRRIIAATARYLGKSRPAPGDAFMKILPPADRESCARRHSLLRLARALNLGRSGAVRGAQVRLSRRRGQADPAWPSRVPPWTWNCGLSKKRKTTSVKFSAASFRPRRHRAFAESWA